ncbi:MAG: lycopene cyclase domain-containing protein [Chloroflexota bacterium]|nr:lycopene cyclase domain-containing protein [Chloroflexota bacterium]
MMFGQYTYLVYLSVFTFVPIGLFWAVNSQFLRKNLKVIGLSAFIILIYLCVTDPFAEAWHTWFFSSDRILGWWVINFPIEEGMFFLLVPIAVACATLSFIDYQDRAKLR